MEFLETRQLSGSLALRANLILIFFVVVGMLGKRHQVPMQTPAGQLAVRLQYTMN
jgi:hypothetical protein